MDKEIRRVRPEGANKKPRVSSQERGAPSHNRKVDEDKLRELAEAGCSNKEIADMLGVSASTLTLHWRHILDDARGTLAKTLRQKQIERAMKGDVQMLIWLGKVYLAQTDKLVVQNVSFNDMSEEDLRRAIEIGRKHREESED